MKSLFVVLTTVALAAAMATTGVAKNGGAGIYAIVDTVTFEPNNISPERIRISGLFAVPVRMSSGDYAPPKRGYLYFRTVPGREQAARKDWASLRSVAGTGEVVGFTDYWVPNPHDVNGNPHHSLQVTVHNERDAASPDDYPLSLPEFLSVTGGLVRAGNPAFDTIVMKQLKGVTAGRD